jgi:hypothetical protein
MMVALNVIEENNILSDRIFKLNGRYKLMDEFNIIDYENIELKDKYVFKKKGNSWMGEGKYVFDTRLWSFDYSLLKETKEMLPKVMDLLLSKSFDLENAYYQLLDLDKVVEFDKVHVVGQIASDGRIQYD